MESVVHNFGSYLEESVRNNSGKDAYKLIKQLTRYLEDDLEENTLNFVISKIFDDPYNYNFLKLLVNIKDKSDENYWKDVLKESLCLLENFLKNCFRKLQRYTLDIIKTCHLISISKAPASEKRMSVDIISLILKNDSNIPLDEITDIYNKYFEFCGIHQKKTAAKVQKSVLLLLGVISNKYPYIITKQTDLIDLYLNQMKRQSEVREKDRDSSVVSGCFEGLSNILESFPIDDVESKTKIYVVIRLLLFSGSTKFDIREIVKFISKHCSMIIEEIYEDSPTSWFETIKKWVLLKGENRKAGYLALECFYTKLANLLKTKNDEKGKSIFQFFFDYFLQTMKNENSDIIEVRLAIRGFGSFAVACEVHLTSQNLSQMFMIIVNRIEQDYFIQENPSTEQLEYLPDYIHCFSTIFYQMGECSFDQIDSLQQISVLMIKTFPKLSPVFHFSVYDSLILSVCYLYQYNPKYLETYLQKVIYQGVLWTCSHRTIFDSDAQNDDTKIITYKNYLPLWIHLLNFIENSNRKYSDIQIDVKKSVIQNIYDELLKTLLLLISKLNLNTKSKDNVPLVDPQSNTEAEKIDDFIIFINVVDFYVDLLTNTNQERFNKWIKMYTNQIMIKSSRHIFVSGFYKLFKLALIIANKLNYFNETKLNKEDRKSCYQKILSYLEKVLYIMQEFKDDLQISCLELLLAIPISFVPPLLPSMGSVFEMALTVGRGYIKLAETAVDTLEKWYEVLPPDDLKPLLKNVLPNLDPFLRSKGFSGDPDIKLSLLEAKKSTRSKAKKIVIEHDTELANLQHKILMFVGQLDLEMCSYLIRTDVEVEPVTWDSKPNLKFTIPYNDIKPNIYLDKIISRVLELALASGDQKTRITACELLHSIVIFMLGTSRQMSITHSKQMSKLFKKIMQPVVQLGCDSNDVVRQLFNPLVFQIIHWYASPLQLLSEETNILIDVLMEGISHPNNTAVRDLCGRCIKEFVIWTINQSQKEDLEKNSQNIYAIIHKLCSFSSHPNPFKRLGAALAFNHLYSHLREEQSMIDIYWIELMYSLMTSMSLEDFKSKNITQLDPALNHIERVLREKNKIFNKYSPNRRIPPNLENALLKDSVIWILKQSGSCNTVYRRKCIQLFCNLAPYVESNCGSVKNFVTRFVANKEEKWFITQYESDSLAIMPTLNLWKSFGNVEIICKWFEYLLKSQDGYKYLLDYDVINFDSLIESSKINDSLKYFVEYISTKKLEDSLKLFEHYDKDRVCLPKEIENFLQWKRLIIISFLDYLLTVMNKCTNWCDIFCKDHYWKFICHCVYEPTSLGFYSNDNDDDNILIQKLTETFDKFCKKLPAKYLNNLIDSLSQYFKKNYDSNITLRAHIPMMQRNLLKGWLLIQKCDLKNKITNNLSEYFTNSVELVFNSLVNDNGDQKVGVKQHGTVEEYSNLTLKLSFELTNPLNCLCECITNTMEIKHPDMYSTVKHGEYFLNIFKDTIMEYILLNNKNITQLLYSKWSSFSDNTSLIILINILKYLLEHPQLKQKVNVEDLFENVMFECRNIYSLRPSFLRDRTFQIELLSNIVKIDNKKAIRLATDFPNIKNWFVNQLTYNPERENTKTILQFHTNILCFLHCVTGPTDDEDEQLELALKTFLDTTFNTSSDKLDNSDLLVLFKKFLDYLIISKSRIVLQSTIDTFTALKYEEDNINIQNVLNQYLLSINLDQQYKSITIVYKLCCGTLYKSTEKYKVSKVFLLTMLRFCQYDTFEQFYIQNIKTIIDNIKLQLTNESNVNTIINKTINLILVDALFTRIDITNFASKSCLITKAIFAENITTGNELLKECIKVINNILKENLQFEDDRKELYRLYHCDAFNSLVSVVCNSKNPDVNMKGFQLLFFAARGDKNVWRNIVDCSKEVRVPEDFNNLPSYKKIFVNIRNEHQVKQEKQIYYIESQSLFNSTLSEDIRKFDFTNTLVRSVNEGENNDIITENAIGSVTMEIIDYNIHECMPTMCALINHMVDNKISPLPGDVKTAELPPWMEDIKKLLIDTNIEVNVRIFISRVIHNTQHIFKYYARFFFEPIVKFICDNCLGNYINYFVADLVLMLISWMDNLDLLEIKHFITNLITFLMKNACNDKQNILKYNLEIIKTCVQIWKAAIEVPHDILCIHLSGTFQEKLVGIHLTAIILTNDLIPWSTQNQINFITRIVTILRVEKFKKITKPTAELIGMILNYLENTKEMEKLNIINEKLNNVLKQADIDKLFHAIEQIQIHYPSIIDNYLRKMSMLLYSQDDPALKCICLKNILRRINKNEFKALTYKDLIDLLDVNDRDVRLLTLQIVNKMFIDLKKMHQMPVLTAVCEYKTNGNSVIRFAVYEVIMTVYNAYINENDSDNLNLIKLCKPILLSALLDSDHEIQEKIEEFWCSKYQNFKLSENYEQFLNDLYSPDSETYYLGYLNYFMLQISKDTPEYKKLIFEYPLTDCKFDDYQVLFNWRLQNASLTPMFANLNELPPKLMGVRQTSSFREFTPTQPSTNLSSSLNTPSGFLFDMNTSTTSKFQERDEPKKEKEYKVTGRRFLSANVRNLMYAKLETDKNIKTNKQVKEKIKRKESNVIMYRQYRKGDFPDVQIPYSAIIDPLKSLARRDNILARQLYVTLLHGLIDELEQSDKFIQNFNEGIVSVFNQTYMYVPNMIGAFLDASFEINQRKNSRKIYINSDVLSTVCKNSGLLPIGCLLMEEYINLADDMPVTSKRGCGSANDEVKNWIKLADMYKELNEWDTVIGIFSSSHMNCSLQISEAIQAEADCKWKDALKKYESLLSTDTDSNRKDFYYESFFKCFSNLSEWKLMSDSVTNLIDTTFWDNDWNQEKLLSWYMMAELYIMLEDSSNNTIINNLNQWMQDKEKADYIKDKFSEELAVLSLLQNDYNSAKHYTKYCFGKFLDDWSHLNPLFWKMRSKKLLNFQKVTDLNKYLSYRDVTDLVNNWQRNSNFTSYSLPLSEMRTLYRQNFINSLENKISSDSQDLELYGYELKHLKLSCPLNLVLNAIEFKNYHVGRKYFKKCKNYSNNQDHLGKFRLSLAVSQVAFLVSNTLTGENKLKVLTDSWNQLEATCRNISSSFSHLQIDSARQIFKTIQSILNFYENNKESYPALEQKIKSIISSQVKLLPDLQNYGINKLRNAITMGENSLNELQSIQDLNSLSEAYLSLIIFAQNQKDTEMYHTDIVKYVLRAMKIGSKEARQIFPCLLQIPEIDGNLLELFKSESLSVPTWMFLLWIPQLLTCLSTSTEAVSDIIERIAITYPQALIYTYRLTKEKYDLSNRRLQKITEKLDNLLNNILIEKFLQEMSFICIPELYFNYHLEKIIKNYTDNNSIKEAITMLVKDINSVIETHEIFKSLNCLSYIENNIKDINDMAEMKKALNKVYVENKSQSVATIHKKLKLKYYSSCLAKFKSSDWNTDLEIPGQYLGDSKPFVKYHAKISGFSPKILCKVNSLRKAFKIVMFGNDTKEYPFLVKFGEDLRQDQRIQQLFSLANNILKSDAACQQRSLLVEQYQVIPLTKCLGLIQVVEETKSLSEFMFYNVEQLKNLQKYKYIQQEYLKWIKDVCQGVPTTDTTCYGKACLTYDKNEVNRMFTTFVNAVPADILSKAFWSISMDTESYIYLRHQFITSYSIMCVIHWLLGIGDRNLGNCLISQKTGRAIGIDFGYAFGASTQHLPIPELIPFRLSPHILSLIEPLRQTGFIEHSMIHCLKALRNKKHLLISTMNVFVKDPSVDWLEYAKSQHDTDENNWYPNEKVTIASKKLNGANSAVITIEELKSGRINDKEILDAYINIVRGDEGSIRKNLNMSELSEEDQVKCMIDQATDYNILGRQYVGLELWI